MFTDERLQKHIGTLLAESAVQIPQCYQYKFPRRYYYANEQS